MAAPANTEPYFRAWDCICHLGKHVWCPKHSEFTEYKRPRPEKPPTEPVSKLDF